MYFGNNDEIYSYSILDIDGEKDIVKFNRHEMDNKSRKNIATYLRERICERKYRFHRGIESNEKESEEERKKESEEETFEIIMKDENIDFSNIDTLCLGDIEFKRKRFKNSYNSVKMFLIIKNGEASYFLREGNRYLSQEESCSTIDLIDKSDNITFYVDIDAWIKIKKET